MNDQMTRYIVFTYLLLWFMVFSIGGVATIFDASPLIMQFVNTLCSWSPTIMLLIMFKRLMPNLTIREFYKNVFKEKLNFKIFTVAALLVVGIFLISVSILALLEDTSITAQIAFVTTALFGNIIFTIVQGASGEESGWRGYVMPEMERRYGLIKGNFILGLIWSFFHLPLWFVSTDYSGMNLVLYIFSFIISLTAFSMMIGMYMQKCNNLLLAFWMHFLFNFVFTFFVGKDVYLLAILAVLYTIVIIIIVSAYLRRDKKYLIIKNP